MEQLHVYLSGNLPPFIQNKENVRSLLMHVALIEKRNITASKWHPDRIEEYRRFIPQESYNLQICPFLSSLAELPSNAQGIKGVFQDLGYEYLELLSIGISHPKNPIFIGTKKDTNEMAVFYRVADQPGMERNIIYQAILSYVMMAADRADQHDLVSRITSVLSKRPTPEFQLSKEEQQQVDDYERILRKHEAINTFRTHADHILFKPKDYTHAIKEQYDHIEDMRQRLFHAEKALANLKSQEYLSIFEENDSTEFLKYLEEERIDNLVWAGGPSSDLAMILKSHMDITQDEAYFKACSNPQHRLHKHPRLARLLKDAMEGKILIPILGTLVLQRRPGMPIDVRGSSSYTDKTILFNKTFYNPHVNSYNCFDQNRKLITQYLEKGEVIHMFEQCIATVGSINLHDGPAMNIIIDQFRSRGHNMKVEVRTSSGWKTMNTLAYFDTIKMEDESQTSSRAEDNQYTAAEDVPF